MANMLERYFESASARVPSASGRSEQELPRPDFPEYDGLYPYELAREEDELIPVDERFQDTGLVETVLRAINEEGARFSLSDGDRQLLDGGVREIGFEAYAFYKSRRYVNSNPYPGKWGIFYLEQGIARVQELIEETYPGLGSSLLLAYRFLREHERFHYKFDFYSLSVESILGRRMYDQLKRCYRRHLVHQVEEALANRDAWEWSKRSRIGVDDFAYDFMKLQPGAYARFDEDRTDLSSELAANLFDLDLTPSARRDDQALWVGIIPERLLRRTLCPEYFVHLPDVSTWILPAWRLPLVRDIQDSESLQSLLESRYASLRERWLVTKRKLVQNPGLPGLDFKQWDKGTGEWSVRVNDNFRAHLHPVSKLEGVWEADKIGPHKAMGHG